MPSGSGAAAAASVSADNRDAARGRLADGERGEVAHVLARVQAARQRVVRHRQRAQPAESLTRDVGHAKNRYAGARRAR